MDRVVADPNFTANTSPEQWRKFEHHLQQTTASNSVPTPLFLEGQGKIALAKLAGSEVIRIRVLNAGPGIQDPEKPALTTALDEITKVWNGLLSEVSSYPVWAEYFRWNVYAVVDYLSGAKGLLLTDGAHIAIKTATGQVWFSRLEPIPESQ